MDGTLTEKVKMHGDLAIDEEEDAINSNEKVGQIRGKSPPPWGVWIKGSN